MQQQKLKLKIQISVEKVDNYNERLTINDEMEISSRSFLEVCSIIGRFQGLANEIKGGK
jgi:hypothetical protein